MCLNNQKSSTTAPVFFIGFGGWSHVVFYGELAFQLDSPRSTPIPRLFLIAIYYACLLFWFFFNSLLKARGKKRDHPRVLCFLCFEKNKTSFAYIKKKKKEKPLSSFKLPTWQMFKLCIVKVPILEMGFSHVFISHLLYVHLGTMSCFGEAVFSVASPPYIILGEVTEILP